MNNLSRRKILILAAVLGFVAASMVYLYLASQSSEAHAEVQVVTAKEDIVSGMIVSAGQLQIMSFPKEMLPGSVATHPEMVTGMIAKSHISAGEPILLDKLTAKDRLSRMVPHLMRAVTVAVDPIIGVGGYLKPGDRVDVVATFEIDGDTLTNTVLQDIELLAIGSDVMADDASRPLEAKPNIQPNATLLVTPMDAEKLILAESKGKLRLTLRREDDGSYVSNKPVTDYEMLGIPSAEVRARQKQARPAAASRTSPLKISDSFAQPTPTPLRIESIPKQKEEGVRIQVVRGTAIEETVVSE